MKISINLNIRRADDRLDVWKLDSLYHFEQQPSFMSYNLARVADIKSLNELTNIKAKAIAEAWQVINGYMINLTEVSIEIVNVEDEIIDTQLILKDSPPSNLSNLILTNIHLIKLIKKLSNYY